MKKRIIAIALLIVMAFSLTACGNSKILVGTWQADFDFGEYFIEMMNEEIGEYDLDFGDYMTSFPLTIITEFREDGTYREYITEDGLSAGISNVKDAMGLFMMDVIRVSLVEELENLGVTEDLSTDAAIEAYLGMSMDEMVSQTMGMPMDEYVDTLMEQELNLNELLDEVDCEGKYAIKGDKLLLSAGLEYDVDPEIYEVFVLEGDKLTMQEGAGAEKDEFVTYPYTMTKIA